MLVLTILGSMLVPASYAETGRAHGSSEVSQDAPVATPEIGNPAPAEAAPYAADDVVRVTIQLEDPAPVDAGYSMNQPAKNASLVSYRNQLKSKQAAVQKSIEAATGKKLDVRRNLTLLMNVISADVRYGDIDTIKQLPGVSNVFLERKFEAPEPVENDPVEPNTANTASGMVGAADVWAEGYTGAGSRIAIIDTGLDVTHQSFAADAFEYALSQTGKTVNLFAQSDFNAASSQLNALTPVYVSSKVPFAYNYADDNTNIDHMNDVQGEHGSHVAGIAAANRFIKSGDTYVDAASTVGAVGMAPDAQLFIMKVFGENGAYESSYVAAIEDALVMDCDVVNMSLGTSSPGFAYSEDPYQQTWSMLSNKDFNSKIVVSISVGNSYSFADFLQDEDGSQYDLYIEDVSMHSGGGPGTYTNSLCVASADNLYMTGDTLTFNGDQRVFYTETENNGGKMTDVAGSYSYVYIDALGNSADYSTVNAQESLSGKIVIVNRGAISFSEKGNNAKSYNPKGLIVANNASGSINMALSDYTGSFPMVSITLADANAIKAKSTAHTAGSVSYYTGTVQVNNEAVTAQVSTNPEISEFSSWGVPGSLTMKPEITAPGGNIYSVFGTNYTQDDTVTGGPDQYELMSGTSMAAPHISGMAGTLGQYLEENGISVNGKTTRQIIQSLLMSTAIPMHIGSEDGPYYPILQQGAGLANVRQAVHASSVIFMNEDATRSYADGKVKAELGDKPSRSGSYTWSFTVYNTADQAQTYALSTDLFTQDRYVGDDGYAHMAKSTATLNWPVSYSTGSSVTVPAHGSKSVTVTISIPEDMSEFDQLYPGGAYVQGFTYVESQGVSSDGAKLDVRHSIPILGFYGSWTDASMFDNMSWVDHYVYGETRIPYSGDYYTNYIFYTRGSSESVKAINGNPYFKETPFPYERLAMRPSDCVVELGYTLVRSAGTIGMGVSKIDVDGNVTEVLNSSVINVNQIGMYFYTGSGEWQNAESDYLEPEKTFASYGAKSGDRIRYGFYAIPEYNAMQVNEDLDAGTAGTLSNYAFKKLLMKNVLGRGAMIGYDLYMDETPPRILSAVKNGTKVYVTVQDDNWIAKLALISGNNTVEELIPEQTVHGETVVHVFDVSSLSSTTNLKVFAGDYASNETTVSVEKQNYTVDAVSNDTALGTVSVLGTTIMANPTDGCYVQSVTVTSGNASTAIFGNVITVTPSENCTVRVNFATKPTITVQCVSNGETTETLTGLIYDKVYLPTEITNTNISEDYSFIGWVDEPVEESEDEPGYYAPGSAYTLKNDTTLYALFKHIQKDGGEVFTRLTDLPDEIEGQYLFTSGYYDENYIMPGYPAGELYWNHTKDSSLENAGITVNNWTTIANPPERFIFNVAKSATPGYYVIQPASMNGVYLANSSSNLCSADSETNNSIWSISTESTAYNMFIVATKNDANWALMYDSQQRYFTTSTNSSRRGIYLWKGEATGTLYYTTDPTAGTHTHELEHHAAVAPTCGAEGNTEYWHCTICDKYFSDAEALHRIKLEDTVLPATGEHSYGASGTSNNGTHTLTCTVCGAKKDEACSYEVTVTLAATYLKPGEQKSTCTCCGYSFTEALPRLANPFEDVSEEDFFFNPVMWALDESVTGGVDETHFAPERTVMRADAMVFFWAANDRPAFSDTSKTFKDVKKKHWAYDAVMWAVENGITGGTDAAGTYFSPQRTCSRSEILQFLYAAMGKPAYTIENPYSDVKPKHWYYDGAIWAYENGMEKGEDGKFNAKTPCTRAYVVTYLYRFITGEELAE